MEGSGTGLNIYIIFEYLYYLVLGKMRRFVIKRRRNKTGTGGALLDEQLTPAR